MGLIGVALRVAKELKTQDLRKLEIEIKSKNWVGTQAIFSSPVQNYLTKAVKTCAKRNTEVFWSSPVLLDFLTVFQLFSHQLQITYFYNRKNWCISFNIFPMIQNLDSIVAMSVATRIFGQKTSPKHFQIIFRKSYETW